MAGNGWRETSGGKGLTGNGWRETGGGKWVAGNGWRERVVRNTSKFYKINNRSFEKKILAMHQSAHSKPSRPTAGLSANCRPTGPDLVADSPIGQQQADGPPVGLLWADWAQSACSGPTVYYF